MAPDKDSNSLQNTEEDVNPHWTEIRSRVDSLSNEIFLISGGALTLSVTVLLGLKQTHTITQEVQNISSCAWIALIAAILFFVLLKGLLIWQSFRMVAGPVIIKSHMVKSNKLAWTLGVLGATAFILGLCLIAYSAMQIIKM